VKIVHLSRSDTSGGAALAAYRLHTALRASGEDSTMLVESRMSGDKTVRVALLGGSVGARARRTVRTRRVHRDRARYVPVRPGLATLFSDDRALYGAELAGQIDRDAVVTLHWIARFVELRELIRALGPGRKYVWRLADMNPFTGGCHADGGCGRYVGACGECPLLAPAGPRDLSHQIWARKRAALEQLGDAQLEVVAVSKTSAEHARASSLLGRFRVTVIPPSVDTTVFRPFNRLFSRRILGMETEGPVLLYAAHSLEDPLKGANVLCEAAVGLEDTAGVTLVTMGHGVVPALGACVRHIALGPVLDARLAAYVYSCADLVVLPSRQEAFGQVVIEALACGVPVAGFDTYGMRDAITEGVTGFVAREATAAGLRAALSEALASVERLRAMRAACRESAARFAADVVAKQYQVLYRRLVGDGGR